MNAYNSFDKTDKEYSLAPTDDLIRYGGQRSRSQQAEVAKASTSMLERRNSSSYKTLYFRCILISIFYVENSLHFNSAYFSGVAILCR